MQACTRELKREESHVNCHDCGKFVKRSEWVPKNHSWKKAALCGECLSYYDGDLMADNAM